MVEKIKGKVHHSVQAQSVITPLRDHKGGLQICLPKVSNFSTILYAQTEVPCHRLKRFMMSHRRGYFPLPDKESKREKNRIAGAPGCSHIICIEHCGKPCRRVHLRPAGRGSVQEALFGVPSRRRETESRKNIVEIIRYPPAVMPDFDKNKISDRGVQEIADYIYNGSDFRVRSKKR